MLPVVHLTTSGDVSVCNYTIDENWRPKLEGGFYWNPFMGGAFHSRLDKKVASQKVNFLDEKK